VAWPSGKAEACKASIPSSNLGATLIYLSSGIQNFMLYVIATPIGNLSDITYRAIETLKICDYILCEDTRHSLPLLKHYGIAKPLKSLHKFNETSQLSKVIEDLVNGKTIALISDAGTPTISDPGEILVKHCIEKGIQVIPIPGACAAITALSASGLDTANFQFCGFIPKRTGERKSFFQSVLTYPGTTICYESPNRLPDVLALIHEYDPSRIVVMARELTKKFEEFQRGTPQELLSRFENTPLKGEIVLLISGKQANNEINWEELSPEEHVDMIQKTYSVSKREAIKIAAQIRQVPKRDIYNKLLE
jgi:16S rRNA (cytidine1402-2'-O)-methyltransferase